VKKVELTERQAVGLAGAIKLLKAAGWSPNIVLPYVREIMFYPDVTDFDLDRRGYVTVRFWFYHQPGNIYTVDVWVELSERPSQLRSKWVLVYAEGHAECRETDLRCQFNKRGRPCKVEGKTYYIVQKD